MSALRIVFMGTPDFAVPALKALHGAGHEIVAVYSQPPRPRGRGQQVQKSPVQLYAEEHGIPVFNPKSLKNAEAQEEFKKLNADVAVVAAYGLILPKAVLDAPKYGCINIHASLLPRWRGASPIQHAIWSGDPETGITLMQMDEGLDTGAVISLERITITDKTTSSSLHDELSVLGGKMIVKAIGELAKTGALKSVPQNDDSTYAPMLKKENGKINWSLSAAMIDRQIRALNPWPGTWTEFEGKRIKIHAAEISPAKGNPGEILDRHGNIGHGLKILKIQPEGKNAMDFSAAVNGGYLKVGGIFT
ncbi:MAG TPA: methionyl-tRNA formyltransferase [Alphaproteobacteria bacterium]|nr:methionyl-tRNA formyltransferase [Alphaproteobacteria bacterium]